MLNEYRNLPAWLDGLERQSRQPDEIVIVDGGSTDGTWEVLNGWKPAPNFILERQPDATIAEGRNAAMRRATGDVIVITDAGTVADEGWLEHLLAPLRDRDVDVVSGFFEPFGRSVWERSLGATTLPAVAEIDPARFLPSSRSVAVRRNWFDAGFEYPEWLDYCEDLVFDLQLKRGGARFAFQPDAIVQFEPRQSWPAFLRQYFQYARGDGKAGLFPARHLIRYASYIVLGVVLARRRAVEIALTTLLGMAYINAPVRRLIRSDRDIQTPLGFTAAGLLLIPIHRFVGDLAKMLGYPVGLLWRLRRVGRLGPGTGWRNMSMSGRQRKVLR